MNIEMGIEIRQRCITVARRRRRSSTADSHSIWTHCRSNPLNEIDSLKLPSSRSIPAYRLRGHLTPDSRIANTKPSAQEQQMVWGGRPCRCEDHNLQITETGGTKSGSPIDRSFDIEDAMDSGIFYFRCPVPSSTMKVQYVQVVKEILSAYQFNFDFVIVHRRSASLTSFGFWLL